MEDVNILDSKGLFLVRVLLQKAEKGINDGVSFTLSIIYVKVISKKFLDPANLVRSQILFIHKLIKIVMIGMYKNFMFTVF